MVQSQQSPFSSGARPIIRAGAYETTAAMDYTGQTVKEARASLEKMWKIDKDAAVLKDKQPLEDDYVIQAGDVIEIIKRQGEKG